MWRKTPSHICSHVKPLHAIMLTQTAAPQRTSAVGMKPSSLSATPAWRWDCKTMTKTLWDRIPILSGVDRIGILSYTDRIGILSHTRNSAHDSPLRRSPHVTPKEVLALIREKEVKAVDL